MVVHTELNPMSPEGLTVAQQTLSGRLLDIGAIKFGDFRLKLHESKPEAPLSPIYIDLRMLRRFPDAKTAAVDVYEELIRPLRFDLLADIPTAATPLVSSLSDRLGIGMITPRTDSKTHGTGAKIDGMLATDAGKKAILIDDLVTRADSKLEAAAILKRHIIDVKDIVVLIDREQGGKEQLAREGFELHRAFTMTQMLDFYVKIGRLTKSDYSDIRRRLQELNRYLGKE